jgi:WD40 repeat protein
MPQEVKAEEEKYVTLKKEVQAKVKEEEIKCSLVKKMCLLSHMDSVRGLTYLEQEGILASVSEDCLVKLWNVKEEEVLEPYLTLRGHVDPIFSICQTVSQDKERLICTAGSEGQVRVWQPPKSSKIIPYGPNEDKYEVACWNAHNEIIWQLLSHPNNVSLS